MIDETIADIQGCQSLDELKCRLQQIAGHYGFASFNFLDIGNTVDPVPFYVTTVAAGFEAAYRDNGYVEIDPYLSRARRTNTPFSWAAIDVPRWDGTGRKPTVNKLMDTAADFRLSEAFIVPYNFRDPIGRAGSAAVCFLWEDTVSRFAFMLSERRHELHVIAIYWAQRAIELVHHNLRRRPSPFRVRETSPKTLTDRERDVLAWAGRGKTVTETADILGLSENTIESYFRSAYQKLGVTNRTHAVAMAIYNNLIDL